MKRLFFSVLVLVPLLVGTLPVQAEPLLQLYIEGAVYDTGTETWVMSPTTGAGGSFRLWAIANVDGPGGKGTINDVRLSAAYDSSAGSGVTITLTPSTTGGFGGFTDPSTPTGTGSLIQTVTDGSVPILGDGKSLSKHGIFGPGTYWQEFSLGDFSLTDSPVGDFIGSFPTSLTAASAQINVYEVTVSGSDTNPILVHFDLYDTIEASNHAKFAPFSHDSEANYLSAPEPTALSLLGIGAVCMTAYGWRQTRRQRGSA